MPDKAKRKSRIPSDVGHRVQCTFVMEKIHGLHSESADMLIKCVSQFRCQVLVQCGEDVTDVRSFFGLLGLAAGWQSEITFTATGVDASLAIAAIRRQFDRQFSELGEKPADPPMHNSCDFKPKHSRPDSKL